MEIERDEVTRQRGGVPMHDYSQSGRLKMSDIRGSREQGNFSGVARALGVFSLALGMMELWMPKRIQKLVGVHGDHSGIIRILGVREIAHALLIFSQSRPQSGTWSRVVGDAIDLSMVGAAFSLPRTEKDRTGITAASLVGVTALDVLTATRVSRRRQDGMGYSDVARSDLEGRTRDGAFHVSKSILINRPPDVLYQSWRNFENLPRFMYHLKEVRVIDDRHSHWVAKAPAGTQVAWDAQITEDRPNELIAWQSTQDADVPNLGQVRFQSARNGQGTIVRVQIDYKPPAGKLGRTVAKLFGEEPREQVAGDLQRFKELMETGEVLRSDASPEGFGQRMQRPARPMPVRNISRQQASRSMGEPRPERTSKSRSGNQ